MSILRSYSKLTISKLYISLFKNWSNWDKWLCLANSGLMKMLAWFTSKEFISMNNSFSMSSTRISLSLNINRKASLDKLGFGVIRRPSNSKCSIFGISIYNFSAAFGKSKGVALMRGLIEFILAGMKSSFRKSVLILTSS